MSAPPPDDYDHGSSDNFRKPILATCFSNVDLGNDLVNKSASLSSDRTWFTLILRSFCCC
ncbi:hypothetical protein RchiOBHm_Chr6g0296161 [Rosa chinensis]|uniref:Uncharacterized protein n=1 Tax=Rosa chinensis TaxID=74649 RepID=A0A2P6PXC1_ROSCH|nr:hypothetical protein RchiOBHm_Chr6g0296161 [Rosa chinensis]